MTCMSVCQLMTCCDISPLLSLYQNIMIYHDISWHKLTNNSNENSAVAQHLRQTFRHLSPSDTMATSKPAPAKSTSIWSLKPARCSFCGRVSFVGCYAGVKVSAKLLKPWWKYEYDGDLWKWGMLQDWMFDSYFRKPSCRYSMDAGDFIPNYPTAVTPTVAPPDPWKRPRRWWRRWRSQRPTMGE